MIFFWPKVYGPLGKTPYIYPRYQVWGVTDLNFDLAYYHPPLYGKGQAQIAPAALLEADK